MRCLRHTTTAALLLLAISASPAHAGDLAAGISVANAVYPGVPERCGTVKIEYGALMAKHEAVGAIAEAHESECRVVIKPGIVASYSDATLCSLLTHEWGHLAGQRFSENPSDPYHSPSPTDNMYGARLVHHPACGESDDARTVREARENAAQIAAEEAAARREDRRAEIRDELSELKRELRRAKAARRRARSARPARYARRISTLRRQIKRLRTEYRSLRSAPLL